MADITEVRINDEYITLGQFLKLTDFISSGGEARFFLEENTVLINGEEDSRRGRKLYRSDLIKIDEKVFRIC